jgi:hypothetical protein
MSWKRQKKKMKLKCFGDHVKDATVLGSSEKDQTINSKLKVMQTYGVHNEGVKNTRRGGLNCVLGSLKNSSKYNTYQSLQRLKIKTQHNQSLKKE